MRNVYEYATCLTVDELMAILVGMQVISVMTNVLLLALLLEARRRLSKLVHPTKIEEDDD